MRGWGLFFFLLFLGVIVGAIGWVIFTQLRARRSGLPAPSWRSYLPFLKSGSGSGRIGGDEFSNIPTPRSTNPIEWIRDKFNSVRQGRNRTAPGNYEEAGGYGLGTRQAAHPDPADPGPGVRRARGMDPDEAWDPRVGNEADAYYGALGSGGYREGSEIGLAPTPGLDDPYGDRGAGIVMPAHDDDGAEPRGRSKSRDPPGLTGAHHRVDDTSYGQGMVRPSSLQQSLADSNNPFSDSHEAPSLRAVSPRPALDSSVGQGAKGKSGGGGGGGGSQESSPTERRSMFRESL